MSTNFQYYYNVLQNIYILQTEITLCTTAGNYTNWFDILIYGVVLAPELKSHMN